MGIAASLRISQGRQLPRVTIVGPHWSPVKNRSRLCSVARILACQRNSYSIRASGICSSSGLRETWLHRRRSGALSSRRLDSVPAWWSSMGHSKCGAVLATLEELLGRTTTHSRNLRSIVDCIRPSVEPLLLGRRERHPDSLMRDAVRANVRAAANHLRRGSELLQPLIRTDGLLVVGAEYSLETGVVTFFDGVPEAG